MDLWAGVSRSLTPSPLRPSPQSEEAREPLVGQSANPAPSTGTWPLWAKVAASAAIAFHFASVLAAEMAGSPSSPLQHEIADRFAPYYELLDQGQAHRFYSDIPPTPIVTAELRFDDGRPTRTVRIPDRSLRPRMIYQRHLALANALFQEVGPSLEHPEIPRPTVRAESFARHLCHAHPGCSGVILRLQLHLTPDLGRMIEAATDPEAPRLDPDAEEFYTTPQRIGDFPCPPR